MLTPRRFTAIEAEVLGMDPATTQLVDRTLNEAGIRPAKGRGPSAHKMRPKDGAAELLGVLACPVIKDLPQVFPRYANLPAQDNETADDTEDQVFALAGVDIPLVKALPPKHTLLQAIEALMEEAANGLYEAFLNRRVPDGRHRMLHVFPCIEISIFGPTPQAVIEIRTEGHVDRVRYALPASDPVWQEAAGDLSWVKRITNRTIFALGDALVGRVRA